MSLLGVRRAARANRPAATAAGTGKLCDDDAVILYRIHEDGHTWPSGSHYLPRFVVGAMNRNIDAADEAWRFFSRYDP
ncbi:MAG: hypothetical protein R3288_07060 [Woeseiaceae bacterium]|nr:hypothetical protein [Woeseiaceae bacterium]